MIHEGPLTTLLLYMYFGVGYTLYCLRIHLTVCCYLDIFFILIVSRTYLAQVSSFFMHWYLVKQTPIRLTHVSPTSLTGAELNDFLCFQIQGTLIIMMMTMMKVKKQVVDQV